MREYNQLAAQHQGRKIASARITGELTRKSNKAAKVAKLLLEFRGSLIKPSAEPTEESFQEGDHTIDSVVVQLLALRSKIRLMGSGGLAYGIKAGNIYSIMKRQLAKEKFAALGTRTDFSTAWINFLIKIAGLARQYPVLTQSSLSLHKLRSSMKVLPDVLEMMQEAALAEAELMEYDESL